MSILDIDLTMAIPFVIDEMDKKLRMKEICCLALL